MQLTGIEIYELLPRTNCCQCGRPACLAFAVDLAAGKIELSACPYVSKEARAKILATESEGQHESRQASLQAKRRESRETKAVPEKASQGNSTQIARVMEVSLTQEKIRSSHHPVVPAGHDFVVGPLNLWLRALALTGQLDLSSADFSGRFFTLIEFDGARMVGSSFENSTLVGCSFKSANLEGATFAQATIHGIRFAGARLATADFSGAVIEGPLVDERTDFTDATFTGCTVKRFNDGSGRERVEAFLDRLSDEQRGQLKSLAEPRKQLECGKCGRPLDTLCACSHCGRLQWRPLVGAVAFVLSCVGIAFVICESGPWRYGWLVLGALLLAVTVGSAAQSIRAVLRARARKRGIEEDSSQPVALRGPARKVARRTLVCPFRSSADKCVAPGETDGPPCSFEGTDYERLCAVYPLHKARGQGAPLSADEATRVAYDRGFAQQRERGTDEARLRDTHVKSPPRAVPSEKDDEWRVCPSCGTRVKAKNMTAHERKCPVRRVPEMDMPSRGFEGQTIGGIQEKLGKEARRCPHCEAGEEKVSGTVFGLEMFFPQGSGETVPGGRKEGRKGVRKEEKVSGTVFTPGTVAARNLEKRFLTPFPAPTRQEGKARRCRRMRPQGWRMIGASPSNGSAAQTRRGCEICM